MHPLQQAILISSTWNGSKKAKHRAWARQLGLDFYGTFSLDLLADRDEMRSILV